MTTIRNYMMLGSLLVAFAVLLICCGGPSGGGNDAGIDGDADDKIPPTIVIIFPCDDTCFQEDVIAINGFILDEGGIEESNIVFNGEESPLEIDEDGWFQVGFDTDKCTDSDDGYCDNTVEVTAVDFSGNTATEKCNIKYVKEYFPRQVFVRFVDDTSDARISEINDGIGAEIIQEGYMPNEYIVLLPVGVSVEDGVDYYNSYQEVELAIPNTILCVD